MKTKTYKIATGALLFALAGTGAAHADIAVNLNGQPLATSVSPLQLQGRTLVPMRDIFEALGAQLTWNPVAQTITAQKDLTTIQLAINNPNALVNGRNVVLEQPATLVEGRTFVPLRFVAEATGAQVDWNGPLQLISIRSAVPPVQPPTIPVVQTPPVPTAPLTPTGPAAPAYPPAPTYPAGTTAPAYPPVPTLPAVNNGPAYPPPPNYPVNTQPVNPDYQGGTPVAALRNISIPDGAVIPVTVDRDISSATAQVGQVFYATIVSRRLGDSEFPAGTKLQGHIIEARPSQDNQPGVLDFDWNAAILPDGIGVPLRGELTSLDSSNVQMDGGRIVANGAQKSNRLKVIGIGAGAGFVLGRVLKTNSTATTILGAAGGYLFGKSRDRKAEEATIKARTTLGVRLSDPIRYADSNDYYNYRSQFLRVSDDTTNRYDPNYYGFDETTAVPRNRRSQQNSGYTGYDYSDRMPTNQNPVNIGDAYDDNAPNYNNNNGDNRNNPPVYHNDNTGDNRQVAGYQQISIPGGAVVPVTLNQKLSSKTATVGQEFTTSVISQKMGDSEFPAGTTIVGRVVEAQPKHGDDPGTLDVEFRTAVLPDGTRVKLNGELVALDDKSIQPRDGRIVAPKASKTGTDRLKIIGVGAAAGFVVGRVLKKDGVLPSALGALGGYLFSTRQGDKAAEAVLPENAKLGIRLNNDVRYADTTQYYTSRAQYLRQ